RPRPRSRWIASTGQRVRDRHDAGRRHDRARREMEILTAGVRIAHRSDVAEWRRRVAALAERAGLDETATARVALVVTELGTNLVRHAGGGWGDASAREGRPGHGVDVLTVDGGPGIADLGRALGDGYSTAGTPGTGIGAVRRQSACFDVFTQAGRGTVV